MLGTWLHTLCKGNRNRHGDPVFDRHGRLIPYDRFGYRRDPVYYLEHDSVEFFQALYEMENTAEQVRILFEEVSRENRMEYFKYAGRRHEQEAAARKERRNLYGDS